MGEKFITIHGGCYEWDDRIARRIPCERYYAEHPKVPIVVSPLPKVETYEERIIRGGTEKAVSDSGGANVTGVGIAILAGLFFVAYMLIKGVRK